MQGIYSLSDYFYQTYGEKVMKLSLDGGFGCPHRESGRGRGGCLFCSEDGGAGVMGKPLSIARQVALEKTRIRKKRPATRLFLAYFQNYTNTYAASEVLEKTYRSSLTDPEVIGLSVATRADCLTKENVAILAGLSTKETWVELGLQSIHPKVREFLQLGQSIEKIHWAMELLSRHNIKIILHLMVGLPGESLRDMEASIDFVNRSPAFGVKLHPLYIDSTSRLGRLYEENPWPLPEREEMAEMVAHLVRRLREDITIHRLTGDGRRETLLAPNYARAKGAFLAEIHKRLKERGQGSAYGRNP